MRKVYASAELTDGATYSDVRVTLASKLQLERSMKANKWSTADNDFTIGAFLAWHAGKTAGKHALTWEEFLDAVVDAGVTAADTDEPVDLLDPTQQAAPTT